MNKKDKEICITISDHLISKNPKWPLYPSGVFKNSFNIKWCQFNVNFWKNLKRCRKVDFIFFQIRTMKNIIYYPKHCFLDFKQLQIFCYTPVLPLKFTAQPTNLIFFEILKYKIFTLRGVGLFSLCGAECKIFCFLLQKI